MQTLFDQAWFDSLVGASAGPPRVRAAAEPGVGTVERGQDWGEAPDILGFVGRAAELTTLRGWVLGQRCRLVAVLGLGGVGKRHLRRVWPRR
jgi:hypothetical protein